MRRPNLTLLSVSLGILALVNATARAQEWEQATYEYEDDAWYDVTEWFDGNDYNPTDEAIGRWDDESYDLAQDIGTDQDSDTNSAVDEFGYVDPVEDDWFYDYYSYDFGDWQDLDRDGVYESSSQYFDLNDDGLYDSYAIYEDTDGDGIYEDYDFFVYTREGKDEPTPSQQEARRIGKTRQSQSVSVSGRVNSAKPVRTPAGKHVIARVVDSASGKKVPVDLGPATELEAKLEQGQPITVTGPKVKVGDKRLVLAQSAKISGQEISIDRSNRELSGTVVATKMIDIRGEESVFARVRTRQGKTFMVDLGRTAPLAIGLSEGTELTVTGPAAEIQERKILIAHSLTIDGQTRRINRSRG